MTDMESRLLELESALYVHQEVLREVFKRLPTTQQGAAIAGDVAKRLTVYARGQPPEGEHALAKAMGGLGISFDPTA